MWLILVIMVVGGFAAILLFNRRLTGLEQAVIESAKQAGWRVHEQHISGTNAQGIPWNMDISGVGINSALYWRTDEVHLESGALVILPRMALEMFQGEGRRLAFQLINSGKNWLQTGMKPLKLALINGHEVHTGSQEFQKRYDIYSTLQELGEINLPAQLETMLLDFPNRPDQPGAPVYVFLDRTSLQIFVETAERNMDHFRYLEMLGSALIEIAMTLQHAQQHPS